MWPVSIVGDYCPHRPLEVVHVNLRAQIQFLQRSRFSLRPASAHQIIFKFTTQTLWASVRISTVERYFSRETTQGMYWSHPALLTPFEACRSFLYFQRRIAWTFVEEGQHLCIKTEHQSLQNILMYEQRLVSPFCFRIRCVVKHQCHSQHITHMTRNMKSWRTVMPKEQAASLL